MIANVDLLVDTTILVDLFKSDARAIGWAQQNQGLRIGIPLLVWMEVVFGARNQSEQNDLHRKLQDYRLILLSDQDQVLAQQLLTSYHLPHGVGCFDCLIAATAVRMGTPLCTLNERHFSVIPNLTVIRPY